MTKIANAWTNTFCCWKFSDPILPLFLEHEVPRSVPITTEHSVWAEHKLLYILVSTLSTSYFTAQAVAAESLLNGYYRDRDWPNANLTYLGLVFQKCLHALKISEKLLIKSTKGLLFWPTFWPSQWSNVQCWICQLGGAFQWDRE